MVLLKKFFAPFKCTKCLLAFGAGILLTFAFAPFSQFYLAPIAIAILFSLINQSQSPKSSAYLGYSFGIGLFASGVHWIYIATGVYGAGGLVAGVISTVLFVSFLALFPATMATVAKRFFDQRRMVFLLGWMPIVWLMWEWIRSWIFTGFPWLFVGYSQIEIFTSGFAPVLGIFGVSYAVLLVAGALALIWRSGKQERIIAAAVIATVLISAYIVEQQEWTDVAGEELSVALVQGNIAQEKKWLPEQQLPTLRTYSAATEELLGHDLIVWPETAISLFYYEVQDTYLPKLQELTQAAGTDVITGIIRFDFEKGVYLNSVMSVGEEIDFYAKKHLVPFGEYLPFRSLLGEINLLGVALNDFARGDEDDFLVYGAGYPIGASVCFEDAFGNEIIQALPEAALLVNISNDGWFGDSIAPHQHLQMAQMRAKETERYLMRSTNTGVSALIDWQGKVTAKSPQYQLHSLSGTVVPRSGATPYVNWGNWPMLVFMWVVFILGIILRRRMNNE